MRQIDRLKMPCITRCPKRNERGLHDYSNVKIRIQLQDMHAIAFCQSADPLPNLRPRTAVAPKGRDASSRHVSDLPEACQRDADQCALLFQDDGFIEPVGQAFGVVFQDLELSPDGRYSLFGHDEVFGVDFYKLGRSGRRAFVA